MNLIVMILIVFGMEVDIISASAHDVNVSGGTIIQNYGRANIINNVVVVKNIISEK